MDLGRSRSLTSCGHWLLCSKEKQDCFFSKVGVCTCAHTGQEGPCSGQQGLRGFCLLSVFPHSNLIRGRIMFRREEVPPNRLTSALPVWQCHVKNPKEKVDKLRYKPLRQGHVVEEQAAHEQALHHVLQRQDGALREGQEQSPASSDEARHAPASGRWWLYPTAVLSSKIQPGSAFCLEQNEAHCSHCSR